MQKATIIIAFVRGVRIIFLNENVLNYYCEVENIDKSEVDIVGYDKIYL